MPEPPDLPTRADLSDDIRDLACKLHWADMKAGGEQTALRLCERLANAVAEYESLLRQDMSARRIEIPPPVVTDTPFPLQECDQN